MSSSPGPELHIRIQPVSMFASNCVVVSDPETRDAVVIDPGGEPGKIAGLLEGTDLVVRAILLTHGHVDHVAATNGVKKRLEGKQGDSIPVYLHPRDRVLAAQVPQQCIMFGMPREEAPAVDHELEEGQTLEFGSIQLTVLHTPGHTPGSCCFQLHVPKPVLIAGDLLFAGSIGRTDFPGGSVPDMERSLQRVVQLPPETTVVAGHGPTTTISKEKQSNPFLYQGVHL